VAVINMPRMRMGRALAVQHRFITDTLRELRSPLTAISLLAERLNAAEMPNEVLHVSVPERQATY
jgi:two-component system OmpR family sensor kinase